MNKFLTLILAIIILYGGCELGLINDKRMSNKDKFFFENLCKNGLEVNAFYQIDTVDKISEDNFYFTESYDFVVADQKFSVNADENFKNKEGLFPKEVTILYDPKNPKNSTAYNPCERYEEVKDYKDELPEWVSLLGLGICFIGAAFLRVAIIDILGFNPFFSDID